MLFWLSDFTVINQFVLFTYIRSQINIWIDCGLIHNLAFPNSKSWMTLNTTSPEKKNKRSHPRGKKKNKTKKKKTRSFPKKKKGKTREKLSFHVLPISNSKNVSFFFYCLYSCFPSQLQSQTTASRSFFPLFNSFFLFLYQFRALRRSHMCFFLTFWRRDMSGICELRLAIHFMGTQCFILSFLFFLFFSFFSSWFLFH